MVLLMNKNTHQKKKKKRQEFLIFSLQSSDNILCCCNPWELFGLSVIFINILLSLTKIWPNHGYGRNHRWNHRSQRWKEFYSAKPAFILSSYISMRHTGKRRASSSSSLPSSWKNFPKIKKNPSVFITWNLKTCQHTFQDDFFADSIWARH